VAAFSASGYSPRDEDVYVSYSLPAKQVARFAMRNDRTMFLFVFADNQDRFIQAQRTNTHKDILKADLVSRMGVF
jgi:hypothetical protein